MISARRLFGYLETGNVPESNALDESLDEHDKKYHPEGFKDGDSCRKRESLDGLDISDDLLNGVPYMTQELDTGIPAKFKGMVDAARKKHGDGVVWRAAEGMLRNAKRAGQYLMHNGDGSFSEIPWLAERPPTDDEIKAGFNRGIDMARKELADLTKKERTRHSLAEAFKKEHPVGAYVKLTRKMDDVRPGLTHKDIVKIARFDGDYPVLIYEDDAGDISPLDIVGAEAPSQEEIDAFIGRRNERGVSENDDLDDFDYYF